MRWIEIFALAMFLPDADAPFKVAACFLACQAGWRGAFSLQGRRHLKASARFLQQPL
jgi:hypothetical protein